MSTIELIPEQQQALDGTQAVRAVDPRTNTTYVIIPEAVYDNLCKLAYDDSQWTDEEMELLAQEAGGLLDRYQP